MYGALEENLSIVRTNSKFFERTVAGFDDARFISGGGGVGWGCWVAWTLCHRPHRQPSSTQTTKYNITLCAIKWFLSWMRQHVSVRMENGFARVSALAVTMWLYFIFQRLFLIFNHNAKVHSHVDVYLFRCEVILWLEQQKIWVTSWIPTNFHAFEKYNWKVKFLPHGVLQQFKLISWAGNVQL